MDHRSMLRVCSCPAFSLALLAALTQSGCGGKTTPTTPEVKVASAEFKIQPVGGPNFQLLCELILVFQTGDQKLEIVETTGDESYVPFSFIGTGNSEAPLKLAGSFVNDGDTSRLEALLERLQAEAHWPESLAPGETVTFLEYEGLDGTPVRYDLRMRSANGTDENNENPAATKQSPDK